MTEAVLRQAVDGAAYDAKLKEIPARMWEPTRDKMISSSLRLDAFLDENGNLERIEIKVQATGP